MWITRRVWDLLTEQLRDAQIELRQERENHARVLSSIVHELRAVRQASAEQIMSLRVGHAAAQVRATEFEQARAISQANFEWVAGHATTLSHRAAELEARVLSINPLAMHIDTSRMKAAKDDAPGMTVPVHGETAGEPVPDMEVPDMLKGQQSIFDDVGDQAAKMLGLDWDDVGSVVKR